MPKPVKPGGRNLLCSLTPTDKAVLLAIYQHRCLTETLLHEYFYKKEGLDISSTYARIKYFLLEGLYEEVDYGKRTPALFLTTRGVRTLRAIYGDDFLRTLYKPGVENVSLPLYSQLRITPKNINHQIHLNQFSLEFASYAGETVPFAYYDEKFMPPASDFMMPDGMIDLPNCYVFLEEDMGTESGAQLAQKWNSYRLFLNDPGSFYRQKPIVMFFIIDGVKNPLLREKNARAVLVKHLIDRIDGNMEIYFGVPLRCHEIIRTNLFGWQTELCRIKEAARCTFSERFGFTCTPLYSSPCETFKYEFWLRRKAGDTGEQSFLLDIWLDGRMSVLRNLMFFSKNSRLMRTKWGTDSSYLIVVPSVSWIMTVLQMMDGIQPQNTFFTTPNRLSSRPWCEAIFCIDQLGNLCHYMDNSLKKPVHEKRLVRYQTTHH